MRDQTSDTRPVNQKFKSRRARRRWLKRHTDTTPASPTQDLRSGLEALEQRTLLSAAPVFELSDLLAVNGGNGSEGVIINGVSLGDRAGVSVSSAGDINGDGYDDIIVGAFRASPNGADSGASYVIFGKAGGYSATQQLSTLNGTNGFKINGIAAGDFSGRSVAAAGDINGDGFDDLLIGSFVASPNGAESGQVHVVYGKASGYTATLNLSSLNGTNGFTINGVAAGDRLGFSVRGAGDVNGDGLDDFILGASLASPNGSASGSAYLVFGQTGFGSSFNLTTLNGTNGFRIDGVSADDQLGISANAAGDVNGDGLADIIVGAFQDDPNGADSGAAFVIFGATSGFASTFNPATLNGTNGFTINGGAAGDNAGRSVDSAGDFNGDGFADLLIGAPDANGTNADSGSAYIVFGHAGAFVSSINLATLNGTNGFKLNGIDTGDRTGLAVSSAGDVNGDGLDDVLIAADRANPNGTRSGETYLVLGRSTAMPASINLSALSGADGFVLNGISTQDSSGTAVRAAGDVNGDGFGDFIIGAFLADPNGGESGQSYLVFGGNFSDKVTHPGTSGGDALTGNAGANVMVAGAGNDLITGNGGADVLLAGQGDDEITITDATFKRIAGGNGTDTLTLIGTGITLDLTTIANSRLTGIEKIDISGGANTLTLNHREVLNLSDTSNTLTVTLDINGTLNMGTGWTQTDSQVVNGNQQTTYTQGRATLIVVELADVIDPVVTINPLKTGTRSPELTGTVVDLDPATTVAVTVNGNQYAAINNGNGTWTLPAGTITPDLPDGLYNVQVVGTDTAGNTGNDQTSGELLIDNAAPVVTVDTLTTNDTTPQLTGTVTDVDPNVTIQVTVNGNTYPATNNGNGTWTLANNTISPALTQGVYNVSVTATDSLNQVGNDASSNELTIDTTAPVVTANTRTTTDATPELTGTVDDATATIQVIVNGINYAATNNGDGTWTLADNTISPALAAGTYDISVMATDAAGNSDVDTAVNGLVIEEVPFTITVNPLATTDTTPQITGTISDATAQVLVTINGTPYAAVNNGDGTWTLADNTITVPLADGVYDVLAQGTIAGPVTLSDDTTNELTIDTTAPVVTVNPLNTSDTTPQLTGTVNETTAVISVTVNGNVYAATNNGDGTWTLADNTINPALPVNTYNVQVSATDAVGNVGTDATTDELIITAPIIPSIDLDDLHAANGGDGTEGTVFNGVAGGDWAGNSAKSAGDVNGDGFDDIVIGANNADPISDNDGTVYVVFGRADGFPAEFDLSTLDGTNGFKINAQLARDSLGVSVASAGDVNGDGIDDLIIGADLADPNGSRSGSAYVIYGKTTPFTATFDLSTLNGTNGYKFNGAASGDRTGFSVNTAGDINGDGLADVVIGTIAADNGVVIDTGRAYVIYGSSAVMPAVLTVGALNGTNGFILTGPEADGQVGFSVSSAGDMNGDGIADLRIGAPGSTVGPNAGAGKTFVVFGNAAGFGTELNLSTLNGTNGFVIEGNAADMSLGFSGSAIGDFNGDGFADLLVSAPASADPASAGSAFVIFGHAGAFPATLSVGSLNGTNGFALQGVDVGDETGFNVSGVGDVNGDGFDDLLVSAHMADGGTFENGEAYLLFGRAGAFSASIDLATIPGNGGIIFNGAGVLDHAGRYVSMAGDVNGDGYADFLVAARDADVNGNNDAGRTYLIYGRDFSGTVTQAGGATGTTLTGSAARDAIIAGAGDDTIVGNGGPDIQSGGQGDDTLAISDTAFNRLAGGNGFDTLRIDGAGVNLDLTAISDSRITGIEQIDVRGTGANTLTLNAREVLNLSDTSNTLLILSDSGDTVDIGTGWTAQGQEEIDGKNFGVFTQGNATLKLYIESTQITGDLNGDGFVGIADLNIVLGNWNQNVTAGVWAEGDPSGDGFVGIADLNEVLGNWNAGTPPVAQASATSATEQTAPASSQQAAPAPAAQTADPLARETSLLDEVSTTTQATQQPQQQQSQSQSQSWAWMQDASRTQRSAFGDADSDSALDLAQPEDPAISRLLN